MEQAVDKRRLMITFLINSFISSSGYISIVVLAIYLSTKISITETSVVIGLPSGLGLLSGILSGRVENKLGRGLALIFVVFLYGTSYLGFVLLHDFIPLLFVSLLAGLGQMLWKPLVKSLFSDCANNKQGVQRVHRARYISICVAGLIGPIIGNLINIAFGNAICLIVSFMLNILTVCILFIFLDTTGVYKHRPSQAVGEAHKTTTKPSRDIRLWIYILSGIFIYMAFIQFESIYSLVLDKVFDHPVTLYSLLLTLNSLFGIILQIIIIKFEGKFDNNTVTKCGIIFFQIGYILFGIAFSLINLSLLFLIIAVFVYSIGEVLTIPGLDVQLDNIIPEGDKKTSYFAIAEIRDVGFVLGPIVTSFVLVRLSPVFTNVCAVILLFIGWMLNTYVSDKRRKFNSTKADVRG